MYSIDVINIFSSLRDIFLLNVQTRENLSRWETVILQVQCIIKNGKQTNNVYHNAYSHEAVVSDKLRKDTSFLQFQLLINVTATKTNKVAAATGITSRSFVR